MARVRDMRNIKNVEDEQSQNNGNHPHAMTDCEVNTSLDSYIENDKKVEGTKEEFKEEVVVHDEFDYEQLSQRIFDRLREFHEKYDNELNNKNVNDFTNNDNDYIRFLESQVAQLQYKLHLLESGE
jgi:hypothetical protein